MLYSVLIHQNRMSYWLKIDVISSFTQGAKNRNSLFLCSKIENDFFIVNDCIYEVKACPQFDLTSAIVKEILPSNQA